MEDWPEKKQACLRYCTNLHQLSRKYVLTQQFCVQVTRDMVSATFVFEGNITVLWILDSIKPHNMTFTDFYSLNWASIRERKRSIHLPPVSEYNPSEECLVLEIDKMMFV